MPIFSIITLHYLLQTPSPLHIVVERFYPSQKNICSKQHWGEGRGGEGRGGEGRIDGSCTPYFSITKKMSQVILQMSVVNINSSNEVRKTGDQTRRLFTQAIFHDEDFRKLRKIYLSTQLVWTENSSFCSRINWKDTVLHFFGLSWISKRPWDVSETKPSVLLVSWPPFTFKVRIKWSAGVYWTAKHLWDISTKL